MARFSVWLFFSALALSATPVWAQGELAVTPGEPWTHAHSGITVPAKLGGSPLTRARTFAPQELDLSLSFEPDTARDFLSFYIFRNTNGGVPVWMAQAQWSIENRGAFAGAKLAAPPEPFTPPGQAVASGLRAVYATPDATGYKSTGVALLPLGDWYVKLRATSRDKSPAELAQAMDGWLKEIGWPKNPPAAPAALPLIPCAEPLAFKGTAQDAQGDMMKGALAGALVSAAAGERKGAPEQIQWCRDSALDGNKAAYRPDAANDAYLLAVGDNGNGVWVAPSIAGAVDGDGKTASYGVTLKMAAEDLIFVAQDRLPSPARTMEIVNAGEVTSSVTTWGKKRDIRINSGTKEK